MRILVIAIVLIGMLTPCLAIAAQTQSEEDVKWRKLENATKAREFYLAGEAANKKGDYRSAVWYWMAALELKPDSDYTRKCLAQAREKLYKRFDDYEKSNRARDPLTCCVVMESLITLLPDKTDLPGRLEKSKAGLNPGQLKALETYREAASLAEKGNWAKARELATSLQALPFRAACIDDLSRAIDARLKPGTVASARLPKLIWLGNDG